MNETPNICTTPDGLKRNEDYPLYSVRYAFKTLAKRDPNFKIKDTPQEIS